MNEMKQLRVKAVFDSNIEKVNPLFSKVKIRIAYTGSNRNNSYISKESFEKAIPTIYNCPIIGEFIETVDDFGTHGGKIEISDKGIKYIQTTKPYGVINESSEITWEDIIEEDGTVNTYLCATGYLWTGRYEEAVSVIENSKSQSMEIDIVNGLTQKINNKDMYAIEDFIFSAFCILGDSTEPCFESSEIMSYSLNKDEFKTEFAQMVAELKQFSTQNQPSTTPEVDNINTQEGGNSLVDEILELFTKYNLTQEQLDFSIEELTLDELEAKLKEFAERKPEDKPVEFSATYRQRREGLSNALNRKIEKDADGNIIYEEYYWVQDFCDTYVYAEKSVWTSDNYECKYGRFTYAFDEANLTATITSEFEEMVQAWLTLEENQKLQDERANAIAEFEKLKAEFEEYKNIYSTPNVEVEQLQEFKSTKLAEERETAEAELFSQYDETLGEVEDYKSIKENTKNFTLEELEKELALLFVKNNAKFSFNSNKKTTIKISTQKSTDEEEEPYGGLVSRLIKK